jgi:hypothetical protein
VYEKYLIDQQIEKIFAMPICKMKDYKGAVPCRSLPLHRNVKNGSVDVGHPHQPHPARRLRSTTSRLIAAMPSLRSRA